MENWELQTQGSKELKTGEEIFLQAKSAVKISLAQPERISEVLRLVMVKIGLRAANWPSQMEKVILIDHLMQNFPENTVEEIKLAFDWAIDGRLELGPDGVNCFENFSCLYLTRIMKAYNKLAAIVKVPEERKFIEYKQDQQVYPTYEDFLKTPFAKRLINLGIKL